MSPADWERWALVFRAGGREAATRTPEPRGDFAGFALAGALHAMADLCDRNAAGTKTDERVT